MKKVFLVLVLLLISFGCKNDITTGPYPFPSNRYYYKAYDTTGTEIVNGSFTLVKKDSINFTGEWHFQKVDDPKNIGPQFGNGILSGKIQNGILRINLNPDYVDNNIFLKGQFSDKSYNGKWEFSSLIGLTNQGTFKAKKSSAN